MSDLVKLSSKLPGLGEINGLDDLVDDLVAAPKTIRVCMCWLDVQRIIDDTDSGQRVPVVRVRRIEPLGDVDEVNPKIAALVEDAITPRTGRTPIPFDTVEGDGFYDPDQLELDQGEEDD